MQCRVCDVDLDGIARMRLGIGQSARRDLDVDELAEHGRALRRARERLGQQPIGVAQPPFCMGAMARVDERLHLAELQQVEATALTIGIPTLRAKQNIEMRGVGQKFSGVYYVRSLRHMFGEDGYSCELTLRKNALGEGAGARSDMSLGRQND